MSGQRKPQRMSDDGVLMFWEAPTSSDLHALKRDHLQAREDRERLATMLRVAVAQLDGREEPMIKPVDRSAAREIKSAVAVMRATLREIDP